LSAQLIGQIAHDFNNVLAVALIGIETAESISSDARAKRFLESASDAIRRGRQLTDHLTQASQAQFSPAPLKVNAFVGAMQEELVLRLGPKQTLQLRLGATLDTVETDAELLGIALLNLARNAHEAMREDGILTLTTHNEKRGSLHAGNVREHIVITASDTGSGMSEEVKKQAFNLFFSSRSGQCGIGLAQVKDLARRSGGSATIADATDHPGVAISVALPLLTQGDAG
jgi:signal transduction histidine kinase